MARPIETWRSETATTLPSSSNDVFRLDPPENFRYTDFVIGAPRPRVPRSMTEEAAKDKYPRARLKRLIRIVEARLGKNRCFFSEFQPGGRKDTQFNITRLYALYEVEHWPGALAQYEWTHFVIANMERDAALQQVGPGVKLALPMLPPSALPKYQEMMRQEGFELARHALTAGQINGVASGGVYRIYASHDPRRHELFDRPKAQHLSKRPQLMVRLSGPPDIHRTLFEIPSGRLQAISQDDQMFRNACDDHKSWVEKELKSLTTYYIRCLGREPVSNLLTWVQLRDEARRLMGSSLNQQIAQWYRQEPNLNFMLGDGTELVERQLSFLVLRMEYHDPLHQKASIQLQTEYNRKHHIVAMLQQRQSLREWTRAMAEQAKLCVGERYRQEFGHVIDLWTGKIETLEGFKERNRKENTDLRSDMLPLGGRPPVCTGHVQKQDQPPQAQGPRQATQSPLPAHQQNEPVEHTQLLTRMQEEARTPMSVHNQGQMQAPYEERANLQSARLSQARGHEQEQLDTEMTDLTQVQGHYKVQEGIKMTDSTQGKEHHQTQVDTQITDSPQGQGQQQLQVDTEMTDSTQAQASEPTQLPVCIELDIPPAESQTPAPKETQDEVRSRSHELDQAQALARLQEQLLMAARSSEETTQVPATISAGVLNSAPMEDVVHGRGPDEEQGQTQQQDLPRAELPQPVPAPELVQIQAQFPAPVPVQETVPPHAQDLSQVQGPSAQSKPLETLEMSLFQQVIQAGLEHSIQADLPGLLESHDVVAVTSFDQIRDAVPASFQEQGQMILTEDAQAQEVPQAEEQLAISEQDLDRVHVQRHVREQEPNEEQAQTRVEQNESQEAQLHADELDTVENTDVGKVEEAVDHESRLPTPFSGAQHVEGDNVDTARLSDCGRQSENTASAGVNKCHHCTKSRLRCNGERPCQFCVRYRKVCYNLDQRPARKMRESNLKVANRSRKKAEQPHSAAPGKEDDHQHQQQDQILSTQQVSANESQGLDTAEVDSHLLDDGSEHLESLDAGRAEYSQAKDQTNDNKQQQQQQQKQSQQTKPARKPKHQMHKARNVTTRLAEQKEAEQGRRSLRAMAHRNHA
ncbi:hypothetical protein PV04_01707 [Phialophora macrospora]|uniref:Zn(2)-C6 fungal-type domain-containing protein n=1 Tax=Phialophora macrospora TaxID=1851006 RepID=A0A0D2FYI1_9EURO|nr:hypothetical protein PV04_01707 [Phialophora macrospora]